MADDVRPIYVPGDRIAFVTNQTYTPMGTRADEYNHGREVTQIGDDLERSRATPTASSALRTCRTPPIRS